MSRKKLTVAEVREIALKNYNRGGDAIVECWTDEDIRKWIDNDGTLGELKKLFSTWSDSYEY